MFKIGQGPSHHSGFGSKTNNSPMQRMPTGLNSEKGRPVRSLGLIIGHIATRGRRQTAANLRARVAPGVRTQDQPLAGGVSEFHRQISWYSQQLSRSRSPTWSLYSHASRNISADVTPHRPLEPLTEATKVALALLDVSGGAPAMRVGSFSGSRIIPAATEFMAGLGSRAQSLSFPGIRGSVLSRCGAMNYDRPATTNELFKTGFVAGYRIREAIYAVLANDGSSSFPIAEGYVMDLPAAIIDRGDTVAILADTGSCPRRWCS